MRRKKPRTNPEIEACIREAHQQGVPIDDLDFDNAEVTGLLDVVLASTRKTAEQASERMREAARTISETAASGTQLRRVV